MELRGAAKVTTSGPNLADRVETRRGADTYLDWTTATIALTIATFGGRFAPGAVTGLIYFLIGPFKFWLGSYTHRAHRCLEAMETAS